MTVDWGIANVFPLFTKGGRDKLINHRAVSLTPAAGRILEKGQRSLR